MAGVRKSDLVGAWRLESWEVETSDGEKTYPFGKDTQGYIMYTEGGFMSVSLMKRGRPRFHADDVLGGTEEERAAAAGGFLTYCGRYEVRGDEVVHKIELSLFPNWISGDQVRFCKLDGDQLTLSAPAMVLQGKERTARLVWRRA